MLPRHCHTTAWFWFGSALFTARSSVIPPFARFATFSTPFAAAHRAVRYAAYTARITTPGLPRFATAPRRCYYRAGSRRAVTLPVYDGFLPPLTAVPHCRAAGYRWIGLQFTCYAHARVSALLPLPHTLRFAVTHTHVLPAYTSHAVTPVTFTAFVACAVLPLRFTRTGSTHYRLYTRAHTTPPLHRTIPRFCLVWFRTRLPARSGSAHRLAVTRPIPHAFHLTVL